MKKFFLPVLLCLMVCPALAQDIVGDWEGTLKTGTAETRMVLHVVQAQDGKLKATLDLNSNPTPVNTLALNGSEVTFTVDSANASYEGSVDSASTEMKGLWTQDASRPLAFKKISSIKKQ